MVTTGLKVKVTNDAGKEIEQKLKARIQLNTFIPGLCSRKDNKFNTSIPKTLFYV
jgi:hypothetical protein